MEVYMPENKNLVIIGNSDIQNMIYTFRGKQVMIDRDLASLYQVQTKRLNEQVKRNSGRFPAEFCFKLSDKEKDELVANCDRFKTLKHSSSNPYAFTEQGIAMLSAVLKSDIAVEVSIKIMNSFVEMRKFLFSNQQLFSRLDRVELKQLETDKKLEEVFNYIASNTEVKQKIFLPFVKIPANIVFPAFEAAIPAVKNISKKDSHVFINFPCFCLFPAI